MIVKAYRSVKQSWCNKFSIILYKPLALWNGEKAPYFALPAETRREKGVG